MPAQFEATLEDVVIYRVDALTEGFAIVSYGRDSLAVAAEFCRRPKWPATPTDAFVGVDNWGHGTIVCATPDLSLWIGKPYRTFVAAAH